MKKFKIFATLGFFFMILSISLGDAVLGDGIVSNLFVTTGDAMITFFIDLCLTACSFLLALYYVPT
ncbi:MAG: hypothetical protein WCL02_07325 [bacterium]